MKLRTANEILNEYEAVNQCVFTHPKGILEMIRTAQREAIEAAAYQFGDVDYNEIIWKQYILNLIPNRKHLNE